MKKLIVLLLALVVVSGAFAQLTVGGYVRAWSTYYANAGTDGGDKGVADMAQRLRLNIANNDPDGNWGFQTRFQIKAATSLKGQTPIITDYAYGWAKFAGGMGKVTAGYIDDTTYHFSQNEANNFMGNVDSAFEIKEAAILLQAMPMPGLSFGVFYVPNNRKLATGNFELGAAYSVEKLLNFKTGWNFGDSKKAVTIGDTEIDTFQKNPIGHFGVEYVGVENLSAVVGMKMDTNKYDLGGGNETKATNTVYSIIGYTMDKLFLEGAVNYTLDPSAYYFEGNVEYTDTAYSIRGFVGYENKYTTLGYKFREGDAVDPVTKLDTRGDYNKMLVGAEFIVPIAAKAELSLAGLYYDKAGFQVPVYVKVSF